MKFFRIITAQVTTRSKLRLPSKFVERYGENLPGFVSLQVPTGAKWRVEVKKKEYGVWFGKGWFRFAESLGVKYGHFLMFDYDFKHAVFHVVAIDMSAVEIEYPALSSIDAEVQGGSHGSACYPKCPKVEKEADVEDDVILMDDDDSNLGRKRSNGAEAQAPFCKDLRKTAKATNLKNDDENINVDSPIGSENETVKTYHTTAMKGTKGKEIILNSEGRIQCVVQGRQFKQRRWEKVLAKAKAFKAEEPVCIIVLQPSYVNVSHGSKKKCYLVFPLCFIEAYFNLNINDAMLRTRDGKTWSIRYCSYSRHRQSKFTYGWRQFAVDNNLRTGDVCLFELIRGAENALKVVIFRSIDKDEAPK